MTIPNSIARRAFAAEPWQSTDRWYWTKGQLTTGLAQGQHHLLVLASESLLLIFSTARYG